jgi:hypothetical protein
VCFIDVALGIAVIVAPAVALLGGGSATAARTGGSSRQIPESQKLTCSSVRLVTQTSRKNRDGNRDKVELPLAGGLM